MITFDLCILFQLKFHAKLVYMYLITPMEEEICNNNNIIFHHGCLSTLEIV